MAVSERCRTALKVIEASLREDHAKSDVGKFACNNPLLVDGKRPTVLEEVELLDTFATYFSFKSDEEIKIRTFYEIFPIEKEIAPENLVFLTKLASLAICVGIAPLLDLTGIWLKIRSSQLFASLSSFPPAGQSVHILYNTVAQFMMAIVSDLLSIPGINCGPGCVGAGVVSSVAKVTSDHPLMELHSHSPVFADAFLSGLTLIYGFHPSLGSVLSSSDPALTPVSKPPVRIIHCLLGWLQNSLRSHSKSSHHSSSHSVATSWTSVDWSVVIRRCKFPVLQAAHFPVEQFLTFCPPIPICLAWWTVFAPLHSGFNFSLGHNCQSEEREEVAKESLTLQKHVADLHYDLLQCMLETASTSSSAGHRHGGSATSGSSAFLNWFIPCSRKLERTKEYFYLEALVHCVREQYSTPSRKAGSELKETGDAAEPLENGTELMFIRFSEFIQVAWSSGRIRNLSADEFSKLLSPLSGHRLISLIRSRLKR